LFPALYAILDPSLTTEPLLAVAQKLADAGLQLIQLRDKSASPSNLYDTARELSNFLASRNMKFILNDRPDIAALVDAAGVHVGQEDLPVEDARKICGAPRWVGVSTHNIEQLRQADLTSADYIAVGPVFPTGTKLNPDPVVGLEFLRQARRLTNKPLVAIGGITIETAADVFRAGADSVAVIRDLLAAENVAERARGYQAVASQVFAERGLRSGN
jgi:thiamine-phosphate pyrophosphorylase